MLPPPLREREVEVKRKSERGGRKGRGEEEAGERREQGRKYGWSEGKRRGGRSGRVGKRST